MRSSERGVEPELRIDVVEPGRLDQGVDGGDTALAIVGAAWVQLLGPARLSKPLRTLGMAGRKPDLGAGGRDRHREAARSATIAAATATVPPTPPIWILVSIPSSICPLGGRALRLWAAWP